MAKVKVRALRPMYFHARGAEFETSAAHAKALVRVGAASYVPKAPPKRNYKRRDMVAESAVALEPDTDAPTSAAE